MVIVNVVAPHFGAGSGLKNRKQSLVSQEQCIQFSTSRMNPGKYGRPENFL